MASITIRDLDDALKHQLRVRAAHAGRSMEEEVRQILHAALAEPVTDGAAFLERIRSRFAGLGDVELPIPAREPMRPPPDFGATPRGKAGRKTARR